jgi:hypothetical protein
MERTIFFHTDSVADDEVMDTSSSVSPPAAEVVVAAEPDTGSGGCPETSSSSSVCEECDINIGGDGAETVSRSRSSPSSSPEPEADALNALLLMSPHHVHSPQVQVPALVVTFQVFSFMNIDVVAC